MEQSDAPPPVTDKPRAPSGFMRWLGRIVLIVLLTVIAGSLWMIFEGSVTGRNRLVAQGAEFQTNEWRCVIEAELTGDQFDDSSAKTLLWYPGLESVSLRGSNVTDATGSRLGRLRALQRLDLSGTTVTDETASVLMPLPNLKFIDLSETQVSDTGLQELIKSPGLKQISVLRCPAVTPAVVLKLSHQYPGVSIAGDLHLQDVTWQDVRQLEAAKALWRQEQVQSVQVSLSDKGFEARISGAGQLPQLKLPEVVDVLTISLGAAVKANEVTTEVEQVVAEFNELQGHWVNLKKLNVEYNYSGAWDRPVDALLQLPLTELSVGWMRIDCSLPDAGISMSAVQKLSAMCNGIEITIKHPTREFLRSLPAQKIRFLGLEDVDAIEIEDLTVFSGLTGIEISDEFLTHADITVLQELSKLRFISIGCPQLDPEDLLPLLQTPAEISSRSRPLTPEVVQAILKASPKRRIHMGPVEMDVLDEATASTEVPPTVIFYGLGNEELRPGGSNN